jgi:hypothetical protein
VATIATLGAILGESTISVQDAGCALSYMVDRSPDIAIDLRS